MNSSDAQDFRLEIFSPELINGVPSDRTTSFSQAVDRGFYEPETSAEDLKTLTELDIADQTVFIAVHDQHAAALSIHSHAPVGTYLAFLGTMNVGGPQRLAVNQISAVTVSPTHRRRGVLRSMITADLQRVREAGVPLAALTASEATIYGRFGFGRVTERVRFELDVSTGAKMRAPRSGTVIAVAPGEMEEQFRALLAAQHETTPGSLSNTNIDYGMASGRWQSYQNLKPAKDLRAAMHLDERGEPDGFITYTFAGWEQDPAQLNIGVLCASTPRARWELIEYLAAHDLITKIVGRGPVDDILPTALVNPRHYKVLGVQDHLWVRILDLPAALAARDYRIDASMCVKVTDDLGFAEGTWQLNVHDGQGSVAGASDAARPDVELDVRDLATLYLGTRSATHLAAAGLLSVANDEVLNMLDDLFATRTAPYCFTDF